MVRSLGEVSQLLRADLRCIQPDPSLFSPNRLSVVSESLSDSPFPFRPRVSFPSASSISFGSVFDLSRCASVEGPRRVLESFGSLAGEEGSRVADFPLDSSGFCRPGTLRENPKVFSSDSV